MFFSATRRQGNRWTWAERSNKERDRQVLLEQTREERRRRLALLPPELLRHQDPGTSAATRGSRYIHFMFSKWNLTNYELQKCYRGRKALIARLEVRRTLNCFGNNSDFLRQLLFFFNASKDSDIAILSQVCSLLLQYVKHEGVASLFAGVDYSSVEPVVIHRVKRLALICVHAVHQKNWQNARNVEHRDISALEQVLMLTASHVGDNQCCCPAVDPRWSFSSQLLSIPFLWHRLPHFKKVFSANGLSKYYIHQIACYLPSRADVLPNDISAKQPGYACVLANAADIIAVSTSLLDALPTITSPTERADDDDDMAMDVDVKDELDIDLQKQIMAAFDSNTKLLEHLVNALFTGTLSTNYSDPSGPSDAEVEAVGSICAFLHVMFSTLPLDVTMTALAYRTDIVPALWNFIKRCHENQRWPYFSKYISPLPVDAPGWLLPVSVFCPIYKYMLKIVDNEEFYEQEKPLSLKDLKALVLILKQVYIRQHRYCDRFMATSLDYPSHTSPSQALPNPLGLKKMSIDSLKSQARIGLSELLTQLQDWNSRLPFTAESDFYSQEATSENFVSQAILGNTRASEIIKLAPFLAPFTIRVKIFTSQLANSKQSMTSHSALTRHRFKIRRSRLLEDAFDQLSLLSEEDLKGPIRVSFVNEHGVEEAGIDGGGIFKDFMENITRAAFDVQYGLFKETVDHVLYPNPGSGLVHEQHLQYFHFLGSLLGKAMYEGILVDLPFATFFLSKLKEKSNFLNDLPSLDPELYRHLLFLKHYKGDVSIRGQGRHFLRGFQKLIPKEWIDMFNEHEIQLLISGSLESLDIDDLRLNTNYSGGYHPDHEIIDMLWEVLKSFSSDNQKKFLKAGVPGLEEHGDRLPTSATCMNLLKLPPYRTKEQLQNKLLYAINSEAVSI
ncbi:hypothetical protein ZWY2020_005801 [Hordeum vulgare]|nr:hypothetical protein ZWY2020_005801 [Hordeum vulgare]